MLFTNPICETYAYDAPMQTVGGGAVAAKPKNVYCTKELDSQNSGSRDSSPQTRIALKRNEVGKAGIEEYGGAAGEGGRGAPVSGEQQRGVVYSAVRS